MDSDTSDILGSRLPVIRDGSAESWAFNSELYLAAGTGIFLWLCWLRMGPYWRQYRETQYRKAMRRRHGIPDNDHRPFNVAYAAATRARQELETEARRSRRSSTDPQASLHALSHIRSISVPYIRQRPTQINLQSAQHLPTQTYPIAPNSTLDSWSHAGDDDFTSAADHQGGIPPGVARSRSGRRSRLNTLPAYGKHALEEEEDVPVDHEKESKKSRLEGDEQIDGKEDAGWDVAEDREDFDMDIDEDMRTGASQSRMKSGDEEDAIATGLSTRRLRKVSRGKSQAVVNRDRDMGDTDAANGLPSIPRGKKRDRGEAGSVFGGDDSVLGEDEGRARRHTRRRTASHKKTSVSSRGQKRGREAADSLDSDEEDSTKPIKRTTRQRRVQQPSDDSDLSMDDGMISHDPACNGRRIGEEWEVNGILYKVGPNGQRLRQALVKRSRSRFPMPKDSEHPDRSANIDVFVETWLSDEQYQEAKDRHGLAWQESPRQTTAEPDTPGDVHDLTPAKSGKNLLWSSIMKDSPTVQRPFRHSIVATVGLRVNPFDQSHVAPGRRISAVQSTPMLPPDSPKLRNSKSYSKWEKQDLEAVAMAKLREKAQKQVAATPEKTPSGASGDKKEAAAAPAKSPFDFAPSNTTSETKTDVASKLPSQPVAFGTKPSPFTAEPAKTSSISFPPAPVIPTASSNTTDHQATGVSTAPTPFSSGVPSGTKPSAPPSVHTGAGFNIFSPAASASNVFAPMASASSPAPSVGMPPPTAPASSTLGFFATNRQSPSIAVLSTNEPSPSVTQSNFTAAPVSSSKLSAANTQSLSFAPTSTPLFGNGQAPPAKPTQFSTSHSFKFGDAKAEQSKVPESSSTPVGGSLFSRIGDTPPQLPSSTSTSTPQSASGSSFSGGKASAPAAATGSQLTGFPSGTSVTSGAAPIKFNFFGGSNVTNTSGTPSASTAAYNVRSSDESGTAAHAAPGTGHVFGDPAHTSFVDSAATNAANRSSAASVPASAFGGGTALTATHLFGSSSAASAVAKPSPFTFGNSSNNTAMSSAPSAVPALGPSTTFGSSIPTPNSSLFGTAPTSVPTQTQTTFGNISSSSSAFDRDTSTAFGAGSVNTFGGTKSTPDAGAPKPIEGERKSAPFKFNFGPSSTSTSATPAFGASSLGGSSGPAALDRTSQPTQSTFGFSTPSSTSNTSSNLFSLGASSTKK